MAHEIASLRLPVLNIDGLFRTEKIPKMLATNVNGTHPARPSTPSPPPSINGKTGSILYAAAVESYYPTSAAQLMARPESPASGRRLRRINPNLVSLKMTFWVRRFLILIFRNYINVRILRQTFA